MIYFANSATTYISKTGKTMLAVREDRRTVLHMLGDEEVTAAPVYPDLNAAACAGSKIDRWQG